MASRYKAKPLGDVSSMASIEDNILPKSVLTRIAKRSLPSNTNVQKEALAAIGKSTTVFINFVTSVANDTARHRGRKTVSAADILEALIDLEYTDFVPQLEVENMKHEETLAKKRLQHRAEVFTDTGLVREQEASPREQPTTKKPRMGSNNDLAARAPSLDFAETDFAETDVANSEVDSNSSESLSSLASEENSMILEDFESLSHSDENMEAKDEALDDMSGSD